MARRSVSRLARRIIRKVFVKRTIVLLRMPLDTRDFRRTMDVREVDTDASSICAMKEIVRGQAAHDAGGLEQRVRNRLAHGMRFYAAYEDDRIMAYLWMLPGVTRYFDEVGLYLEQEEEEVWLRDIYVSSEKRGQRVLEQFLGSVIARFHRGATFLNSDVRSDNAPSLSAHHRFGFVDVGCITFVSLVGRLLVRNVRQQTFTVTGVNVERSVVLMGRRFREHRDANSA